MSCHPSAQLFFFVLMKAACFWAKNDVVKTRHQVLTSPLKRPFTLDMSVTSLLLIFCTYNNTTNDAHLSFHTHRRNSSRDIKFISVNFRHNWRTVTRKSLPKPVLSNKDSNFLVLWDMFPEGYYEKFSEHKLPEVH